VNRKYDIAERTANQRNNEVVVKGAKGRTKEEITAELTRVPEYQAAATIHVFEGGTGDLQSTILELASQTKKINGGNMNRPESLLAAQAHTLDTLFNTLAQRSHANMAAGYGDAADRYLRLALRAQVQCRTTIEAISAIKNPPVVFAKQMNVSHGHQQINNGTQAMASDEMRTHQNEPKQNKLIEATNGNYLDTGATSETVGNDFDMAAVVKINRAKV